MADSLATIKVTCHTRSNSLPSSSHPVTASIEDHLRRLKACDSTSPSASSIRSSLNSLKDLHGGVNDMIHLPSIQNALFSEQLEKWAQEVLDGSLNLLDACGSVRDIICLVKESVQHFESSIRRTKSGVSGLEHEVNSFRISRKKINKMFTKSIRNLKKLEKNCSSALLNKDSNLVAVTSSLQETEKVTLSILRSVLTFASGTKESSKQRWWPLVSKFVQPSRIHYVTEQKEEVYDLEKIDDTLHVLIYKSEKDNDAFALQNILKQLESLEFSIQEVEEDLEAIYKILIKRRVSLLNAFSH